MKKEWAERNNEHIKEKSKNYLLNFRKEINQRQKEAYNTKKLIEIKCLICNKMIKIHNKTRHNKTKKHINNLNKPTSELNLDSVQ